MPGDVQRRVRIVYALEGVDQAAASQETLAEALDEVRQSAADQGREIQGLESRWDTVNAAFRTSAEGAREATQAQMLMHQQVQALAGGLSGLSSIIGTSSEAGALVGRMGQFASVGIQLGSILGPQGAIVGGVTGAIIPAFQSMLEALEAVEREESALTVTIDTQASAYDGLLESIRSVNRERSQQSILSMGLGSLEEQQAAVQVQERTLHNLNETAAALSRMAADEQNLRALTAVGQARVLTEQRLAAARQALELAQGDDAADAQDFIETGDLPGRPSERQRRRGGARRRPTEDPIFALARGRGQDDSLSFALGLGGGDDRPSDFELERADQARQSRNRGFAPGMADRAQLEGIRRVSEAQQRAHEQQMRRIEEQVAGWTNAAQQIGSSLFNAFTIAVSGQEKADVAFAKSFKSLAIQFGGQMVNEGLAALLTAAGNVVANPPVAATKAAEGAGKLALGIGLGAAGAAIPVPSSGGAQAQPPRLGPAANEGQYGGSVTVLMNAPAIITGTRAETGRELERTLRASRNRFGRAA